jgi:hypothetical protein
MIGDNALSSSDVNVRLDVVQNFEQFFHGKIPPIIK